MTLREEFKFARPDADEKEFLPFVISKLNLYKMKYKKCKKDHTDLKIKYRDLLQLNGSARK